MTIQRNHFSKILIATTAGTLLISFALQGDTPLVPKSPRQDASTAVGALVIPNFRGASDMEICKLRDGVEEQQEGIRAFLLEQLEDEHLSPLGRVETISLLGAFKPDRAVITALIQNMNVVAYRRPDEHTMASSRRMGYIARSVLADIGAPAEEEILSIIGSPWPSPQQVDNHLPLHTQNAELSKAEGFAAVISQIEGKQKALFKLHDAQAKAKSQIVKAQFQNVIKAVEKGQRSPIKY